MKLGPYLLQPRLLFRRLVSFLRIHGVGELLRRALYIVVPGRAPIVPRVKLSVPPAIAELPQARPTRPLAGGAPTGPPLRILFLVHQFYPDSGAGTERVTLDLCRALQAAGHHVRVLTSRCATAPTELPVAEYVFEGIPVSSFRRAMPAAGPPNPIDADAGMAALAGELIRRERIDLVHVMHPMRTSGAIDAAVRSGKPYIVTLTDYFLTCYRINLVTVDGLLCEGAAGGRNCVERCQVPSVDAPYLLDRARRGRQVLEGARALAAPSAFAASVLRLELPTLAARVIEHGIDRTRFRPKPPRAGGPVTFGFVGTLVPLKGPDLLVSAFRRLTAADARLVVFGGPGEDAVYHGRLLALARTDPRISFRGRVAPEEVASAYASMDVLCVPSRVFETFSLALREATACGVPAIVARLGALAGAVEDGVSGRAFEPGSEDALLEALEEVCAHRGLIREWHGHLRPPASIEDEAGAYERIYREIL